MNPPSLEFIKGHTPKPIKRVAKFALNSLKRLRRFDSPDPEIRRYVRKIRKDRRIFRNELFPPTGAVAWLDREDWAKSIERKRQMGLISDDEAETCRKFAEDGYVILPGLVTPEDAEAAWSGFEREWKNGNLKLGPRPAEFRPSFGRLGNVHRFVPEMFTLLHHPKILRHASLLLGKEAVPFQTIPSIVGSEQLEHSDAIHMCTYPLGFLVAAWIALEDISPDSGPLVFYPGSHRLPYHLSREVGIGVEEFNRGGRVVYTQKYEPYIQNLIRQERLTPHYFLAKKGDVLIWHHNLIHGGSLVKNQALTRKSLVSHYFTEGVICYHDLSNSLADLKQGFYHR